MQFAYQPGQQHENVTFWAGPTRPFGSMVGASPQDFVPVEETGFYLRPEHLDPKAVFMPVGLQVEVVIL